MCLSNILTQRNVGILPAVGAGQAAPESVVNAGVDTGLTDAGALPAPPTPTPPAQPPVALPPSPIGPRPPIKRSPYDPAIRYRGAGFIGSMRNL